MSRTKETARSRARSRGRGRGVPFLGSSLVPPIQAEKDRAEANGASIERGVYRDLIQPVYNTLDRAGEWGNVVFFGVPGVRKVVNGSVKTIFDQSENENDASQSTSSKRPSDDLDVSMSKIAANFDGTDDFLAPSGGEISDSNFTIFSVLSSVNENGGAYNVVEFSGNNNIIEFIAESDGTFGNGGSKYFGFLRNGTLDDRQEASRTSFPKCVVCEHVDDFQIYENNDALSMTSKENETDSLDTTPFIAIGARTAGQSRYLDGNLGALLTVDSVLSQTTRENITDTMVQYYNL